jgi:hypothetical protein
MPTRRQFIQTGLAGGALLGLAYLFHDRIDRLGKRTLVDAFPLEGSLRLVVAAVVPVVLAGALPADGTARRAAVQKATDAVAVAVSALSAPAQREIAELFALLAFAPTRIAVAGVVAPWPDATEDVVAAFLTGWRNSRVDLLKSGYLALHDLVLGAWYADPSAWDAIGYPGPPRVPHA